MSFSKDFLKKNMDEIEAFLRNVAKLPEDLQQERDKMNEGKRKLHAEDVENALSSIMDVLLLHKEDLLLHLKDMEERKSIPSLLRAICFYMPHSLDTL